MNPDDRRIGSVTRGARADTVRIGENFVGPEAPTKTTLVTATAMPENPCVLCASFEYDHGQAFLEEEGTIHIPKREGGFLKPANHLLQENSTGDGGMYDSREYGNCRRWCGRLDKKVQAQLTHRFSTCPEWSSKVRFRFFGR